MGNRKQGKRLWKAAGALLLSAALALSAPASYLPAGLEAYAAEADANGFVIEDGVLTKYTGTATEVVIPEGVTGIGYSAFHECNSLTSITIPNSVTSIGTQAFYGCSSLTSISIPDSVSSIGHGAFYGCSSLTRISIPDSVSSIGDGAFGHCISLTIINIPDSVSSIGAETFYNCSSLTSITIPDGVSSIGEDAFTHCRGLTSINIPNSVTYIGQNAFDGCNGLTSITIPASVTNIGMNTFIRCSKLIAYGAIYGEEDSYAQTYAKENNIPFRLIGSASDVFSSEEIEQLIEENKTQDTVIQTADGLTFTFKKGTMELVAGIDSYDFGAEIVLDYSSLQNPDFTENEFAFKIDYNYEGQLPGEAAITIPIDSKWAGKRLYYYEINDDGTYSYMCRSTVTADGSYTVTQSHCSSYVATTKVPENLGDCDGESGITSNDALAILKYDVGIPQENFIKELADCDGEDGITSNDALAVSKYDVGILDEFK